MKHLRSPRPAVRSVLGVSLVLLLVGPVTSSEECLDVFFVCCCCDEATLPLPQPCDSRLCAPILNPNEPVGAVAPSDDGWSPSTIDLFWDTAADVSCTWFPQRCQVIFTDPGGTPVRDCIALPETGHQCDSPVPLPGTDDSDKDCGGTIA